MAVPKTLEDIIRQECLPQRDCMLTLTDSNGEAAFLYFKEAELIEANYGALWGKEALAQIVTWKLEDYTIAPLPLGIKRSLWDRLEYLLNPSLAPTASGKLPSMPPVHMERPPASPFDRFKAVPNLLKMVYLEGDTESVIFNPDPAHGEDTAWFTEFTKRVKMVGDTLGFGVCDKWTLDTDRYQAIALSHESNFIALLRRKEADDLETVVNKMIEEI